MKKDRDRQVGIRVGLPVFFAMELEDVYRHTPGAHRALAFPDFCGLLLGAGLETYRRQNVPEPQEADNDEASKHVVEASPGHKIEILKDANFDAAPYWFFVEPEDPADDMQFYSAQNDELAIIALSFLETFKGAIC